MSIPGEDNYRLKVEEWLEKEGYSLEFLTATAFEKKGFDVTQSNNYWDEKHNMNREVDVAASYTYMLDKTVVRVTHIMECKWSKDKPWVVFCSRSGSKHPAASIAQSIGSYLGEAILWHMAGDESLYGSSHFYTPEAPGFSGRQALTNSKDLFYSSMQGITASAELVAKYYDPGQILAAPSYAEIVFPVIVVNGNLFRAVYNDSNEKIDLVETNHIRLHWDGSDASKFNSNVDIITSDYVEEFAEIRSNERVLIVDAMERAFLNLQECIKAQSLKPLTSKRAPRGFTGLPKLLHNLSDEYNEPDGIIVNNPPYSSKK